MKKTQDPEDLKVAITFLRAFRGWNQTELARASGIDKSLISLYELGRKKPSPKTMERLLKATGVPSFLFEDVLRMVHLVRDAAADLNVESSVVAEDLAWAVALSLKIALIELLGELEDQDEEELAQEAPERERAEAEELWSILEPFSAQDRRLLVEEGREFRSWALVERICQECEVVAPNDPIQAQEIAELALMVAARVPGNDGRRSRLEGYAWVFMGGARRTAGDVAGAEEAFQRARHLWHAGAPESFALLDEDVFQRLQSPN